MKIVGWIFSVFFGISAFGLFAGGDTAAGFVCLVGTLLAIPPVWAYSDREREKHNLGGPIQRKYLLGGAFALYVIAIIIGGNSEKGTQEVVAEVTEVKVESTLGITGDGLRDNYNNFISTSGLSSSYMINTFTEIDGEVNDVIQYMPTNEFPVAITGSIDKSSNEITGIVAMYKPDAREDKAAKAFIVLGALVASTNSELTSKEAGKVLSDLISQASENKGETVKLSKSGYEYSMSIDDIIGLMMTVSKS